MGASTSSPLSSPRSDVSPSTPFLVRKRSPTADGKMRNGSRAAQSRARLFGVIVLGIASLVVLLSSLSSLHESPRDIGDNSHFNKVLQSSETVYFSNELPDDVHESFCPENDLACFNKTWQNLKKALCPNMVPNTRLAKTLFSISRDEIGLRQWNGSKTTLLPFYQTSPGPDVGFVYTSPENQTFVYVAIWKAAHQTVMQWAKQRVKPLAGEYREVTRPELQQILKDETTDPCIVTMIRDPVSHFLSGYNEIDTRIMQDEYNDQSARMKNAPKALFHRYHYGTKERFEQFVADILSQPYTLGWNGFRAVEPAHFYSMSAVLWLLSQNGDAKMTNVLPSMQNLAQEWPKFAYNACPGALPESVAEPFHMPSHHESSKDKFGIYKAAKNVWSERGPTARALCVLHAIDYACWENVPDGIPVLCREVFSSRHFVNQILKEA